MLTHCRQSFVTQKASKPLPFTFRDLKWLREREEDRASALPEFATLASQRAIKREREREREWQPNGRQRGAFPLKNNHELFVSPKWARSLGIIMDAGI